LKTVLLAWELGAGLGHVVPLRWVAQRLIKAEVSVTAAVKSLSAARLLAEIGVRVLQAPIWPVTFYSDAQRRAVSSATLIDSLAGFGLADPVVLSSLVAAWRELFALVKPDLVIADFAPAAALAARHYLPLAAVGQGYSNPPAELERFPLLHQYAPPIWKEATVLATVNEVLASFAVPPLGRIGEIFRADVVAITNFPLLDPYRAYRSSPARGPFFETPPIARRPDAAGIYAYLSSGELRKDVVAALLPLGPRVRLFAPGLIRPQLADFREAGASIAPALPNLFEELAGARLAVHVGSATTAAGALAAGVPQIILSLDVEKDLTGVALEQAGVGKLLRVYDPAVQLATDTVIALAEDSALAARASAVGMLHRRMLGADPLAAFVGECLELLKLPAPPS
jgi:UDP:flavonoid glycosyltransferase YjiC (YdhE family)